MKNVVRFIKNNILGIIIGILIGAASIVLADTINSNEVLYDNSNSSSSATNVQGAIDDVYNTLDKVGSGYSLIAHAPEGLSTELVAGLYRYQGVQDASHNVNNYICFGTVDKSTCVGDTDKYMYRIIGINTNGQMKLIKKEALNTDYGLNLLKSADWPSTPIYIGLNGSYFLDNNIYIPDSTWEDRIAITEWHYASFSDANVDFLTLYTREIEAPAVNSKIGLMYLHDYFYALPGGINCSSSGSPATCLTNWIHLSKNDPSPPRDKEWIITRYDINGLWTISLDGTASYHNTEKYGHTDSVRPVFFLNSNERIASGNGTITDPYILS